MVVVVVVLVDEVELVDVDEVELVVGTGPATKSGPTKYSESA